MEHTFRDVEDAQDVKELSNRFRQVIGAIVILCEPLSAITLGKLLLINKEIIDQRPQRLQSVFNVLEHEDSLI